MFRSKTLHAKYAYASMDVIYTDPTIIFQVYELNIQIDRIFMSYRSHVQS
jgi:hypothetical protein